MTYRPDRRRLLGTLGGIGLLGLGASACGSTSDSGSSKSSADSSSSGSSDASYTAHKNLAYAAAVGDAHFLDIYVPTRGSGPFPVVVLTTGSAFRSDNTKNGMTGGLPGKGKLPDGAKLPGGGELPEGASPGTLPSDVPGGGQGGAPTGLGGMTTAQSLAKMWAQHGYVIVGCNVRSSSQAHFPAQVYDIKAAIRFLRANASTYSIDTDRIATMGTSSGAWVATMAATTNGRAELEGDLGNAGQSSAVQACIDLFGPTDFLQMDAHVIAGGDKHDPASSPESQLMGFALQTKPAQTERANPCRYVTKQSPPIFITHGTADPLVPYNQSQLLFAAYEEAGADATFCLVPKATHTDAYLSSAKDSVGRTVKVTENGTTRSGATPAPTYAALLSFLDSSL